MIDIIKEYRPAAWLIIEEYKKLQEINKNDDLLKYFSSVEENKLEFRKETYNEFIERFNSGTDEEKVNLTTILNYYTRLRHSANNCNVDNAMISVSSLKGLSVKEKFTRYIEIPTYIASRYPNLSSSELSFLGLEKSKDKDVA